MRIDKNWVFFAALFATLICGCKNDNLEFRYTYVRVNGESREEQFIRKVHHDNGTGTTYFLENIDSTMKFFFHLNKSGTSKYVSGSDTAMLEYFGCKNYIVGNKTYMVEGYITVDPPIDASEGIFYNEDLGIIHIVSYSWGNYLFLSSIDNVSENVLMSLNQSLMEDSTFYFKLRYPLPPPPK